MKFLAVCACLALVSVVVVPHSSVYSQRRESVRPRYADDRIVVKFRTQSATDMDSVAEEIFRTPGLRTEALTQRLSGPHVIHLDQSLSVEEAINRASADPRVEYAE